MTYAQSVTQSVKNRYPHEPEFVQAVAEMLDALDAFLAQHPQYQEHKVLERLVEPDRLISFRVTWLDDQQHIQTNRGYRVQFSSVLGPYKGGLRFHPSVNPSILKFLAFEQIFKDSLTGLWLGGAKGGSDFDPKGKSDAEVMRFCQAFMTELYNYIDPDTDVPAGDIGVGAREIGYLFGWYKKLAGKFHGSLTGKGTEWGGSNLRTEATGYGLLYFVEAMLGHAGHSLTGQRVVISGSGNVAQYAAEKSLQLGATVLTLSDSSGYIYDPDGITAEKLAYVKQLKTGQRGRIQEYAQKYPSASYQAGQRPWSVPATIYLPCATQNEIETTDAKAMVAHRPLVVAEGANMPTTPEAMAILQTAGVLVSPAKASNAGGVAVSGLEMSQNMTRLAQSHKDIDTQLRRIMADIHAKCVQYGTSSGGPASAAGPTPAVDYARGANIAGFVRVADALIAQGVV